jgi:hypothetical protein
LKAVQKHQKIAQEQLEKFGLTNVEFVVSEFRSYLEKAILQRSTFP